MYWCERSTTGQQDGRAGNVGEEAVGVHVGRELAHALGYVESMVEDLNLGCTGALDKGVRVEG
jgi:hypothetical protein